MALLQDSPSGPELSTGDFAATVCRRSVAAAQHPAPLERRRGPAQGKHCRPTAQPGTWLYALDAGAGLQALCSPVLAQAMKLYFRTV